MFAHLYSLPSFYCFLSQTLHGRWTNPSKLQGQKEHVCGRMEWSQRNHRKDVGCQSRNGSCGILLCLGTTLWSLLPHKSGISKQRGPTIQGLHLRRQRLDPSGSQSGISFTTQQFLDCLHSRSNGQDNKTMNNRVAITNCVLPTTTRFPSGNVLLISSSVRKSHNLRFFQKRGIPVAAHHESTGLVSPSYFTLIQCRPFDAT